MKNVYSSKNTKAKEPVRMRYKPLRGGGYSIYLDTYSNGRRSYEFLKMYLVPEDSDESRERNRRTMLEAQVVKARRLLEVAEQEHRLVANPNGRRLLTDSLDEMERRNAASHRGKSSVQIFRSMRKHLENFIGERLRMMMVGEIDETLCRDFAVYLRGAKASTGIPLSGVSVYHYYTSFKVMVGELVRVGLLSSNPLTRLTKQEQVARPIVTKGYLSADEVMLLAQTYCRMDVVKRAFMFSCLTGLRLSDVRLLCWHNIRREGRSYRLNIVMQKTLEPIEMKLSEQAVEWLPEKVGGADDDTAVFDLPCNSTLGRVLQEWTEAAGLGKHVTFHTARHSFATMALMAGTDIYVISKLLGHRNINTTTVYAAVVDKQRDAAVDGIGRLLRKQAHTSRKK